MGHNQTGVCNDVGPFKFIPQIEYFLPFFLTTVFARSPNIGRFAIFEGVYKLAFLCDCLKRSNNEISFELRMETILMLVIFAVLLRYLSSSEREA